MWGSPLLNESQQYDEREYPLYREAPYAPLMARTNSSLMAPDRKCCQHANMSTQGCWQLMNSKRNITAVPKVSVVGQFRQGQMKQDQVTNRT